MKLFQTTLAALLLLGSLFTSAVTLAQAPTEAQCSVLYAGQTTEVGAVCVTINTDNVYLDYLLIGDWKLSEAHAWIGDNLSLLPVNGSGNPQIGLFPHSASNLNSASHSFTIPLSSLAINADTFCNADVFVAAHAVVSRVIAGGDTGGGTGGGSGDGKSDKSGKSGKSDKSGKSCQSGKSDKSGQSGKGSSKGSSGKGSSSSAKSSGGKSWNAVSDYSSSTVAYAANGSSKSSASNSSSKNKGSSGSSSKGKSDKSGKSGKSGDSHGSHAGHHHGSNQPCNEGGSSGGGSSGGGSGGGTTNPVVQTESAWAGTLQINAGGSWARYFTFKNDFCEDEEEDPGVVLPQGCFNVFAKGDLSSSAGLTGVSSFSPLGITDGATGYLNTFDSTREIGFSSDLLGANGTDYGNAVIGYLNGSQLQVAFELVVSTDPTRYLQSVRAYVGGQGSFANIVSPALYGQTATQFPDFPLLNLGSDLPGQLDIVLQATICNEGGSS